MARFPRGRTWLTGLAVAAVALVGVTAALAQTDEEAPTGSSPADLQARLALLEEDLPARVPPTGVDLDEEETWGSLEGDATSVRASLDVLEPELRQLFIDADEVDGDVADAVAEVARGWLDIWTGTRAIAVAESADLAFPVDTEDDDGVATGADELRGQIETGLNLLLSGQERLLTGYGLLEELGEAPLEEQVLFDARARDAADFDAEIRPAILTLLSQPSASVLVTTDRFETDAPGVRARANSMTVVCVDREALEELGGVATDDVLEQLEDDQRIDCADLPGVDRD
ncbi:MAG: hypothetical protein ACLFS9_03975 [Nitriliruptoraceae bacterium]